MKLNYSFVSVLTAVLTLMLFSCGKYSSNAPSSADNLNLESYVFYAEAGIFADESGESSLRNPRPDSTEATRDPSLGSGGQLPSKGAGAVDGCSTQRVATELQQVQRVTDYFSNLDPSVISPEKRACVMDRLSLANDLLQELNLRLSGTTSEENCRELVVDLIAELGITRPASCQ